MWGLTDGHAKGAHCQRRDRGSGSDTSNVPLPARQGGTGAETVGRWAAATGSASFSRCEEEGTNRRAQPGRSGNEFRERLGAASPHGSRSHGRWVDPWAESLLIGAGACGTGDCAITTRCGPQGDLPRIAECARWGPRVGRDPLGSREGNPDASALEGQDRDRRSEMRPAGWSCEAGGPRHPPDRSRATGAGLPRPQSWQTGERPRDAGGSVGMHPVFWRNSRSGVELHPPSSAEAGRRRQAARCYPDPGEARVRAGELPLKCRSLPPSIWST